MYTSTNKMAGQVLVRYVVAVFSTVSILAKAGDASRCRYIPSDDGWPTQGDWTQLNQTVGGRLIATDPQAHVCHAPTVNESACDALRAPTIWNGTPPL